jgi:uncharacterized phage protein gp47/JayE
MSGIGATGFVRKTLLEIKTEVTADLVAAFGQIRSDYASVFGNIIAIFSAHLSDIWELLEVVYQARSVGATGIALDDIVNWVGVTRLPAMATHVTVTCVGTPSTVLPSGTIVRDSSSGKQYQITTATTLIAASQDVDFTGMEYGPIPALSGNVTQIITPVVGLTSVTNAADGTMGRNQELDAELRARFLSARSLLGFCRLDAIQARIISEVDDVASCSVYENVTDATVDTMPPHSIEVVVDCPVPSEQLVADKICEVKAAGISTHGDLAFTVADSQGLSHTINLSKIIYEYAHVRVTLTYSSEVSFPSDGIDLIKAAIKAYGDTLKIGNDIIVQAFMVPVYGVPGITAAVVEMDVTPNPGDTPSYSTSNIAIASNELAKFDLTRITVA